MEPFKNIFSAGFVNRLADAISAKDAKFKRGEFLESVLDEQWEARELKDRMHHIARQLHVNMSGDYPRQIDVLMKVAPGFKGLPALVFPDFVEMYGLDYWKLSIPALEKYTVLCSSEFAVRPFIIKYPDRMMRQMRAWAKHANEHVRRLASEGCRPRLPWAMALPDFKRDPAPVLPILEMLRTDPSEYVRRSVANNLNDISKDHPNLVLDIAREWVSETPETKRLVKHACRTLLKKGDARAMKLFGFHQVEHAKVIALKLKKTSIPIGGTLEFSFIVEIPGSVKTSLRIEYAVDYLKSRGGYGKKVFKITEREFKGREQIIRKHHVKDLTTRIHYPGLHHVTIVINGKNAASASFELVRASSI